MATLSPTLTTVPHCLNFGATELSKLSVFTRYLWKSKVGQSLKRIDIGGKLFPGEVVQNAIQSPHWSPDLRCFAAVEQTEQSFTTSTQVDELEKLSAYLFRTEIGGQVKLFVRKKSAKYVVDIEVSSMQLSSDDSKLVLSGGVYRSDHDIKNRIIETPFVARSSSELALELEFEAKEAPFYFSFLLKASSGANSTSLEIRGHRKTSFCVPIGFDQGHPAPLGLSFSTDGSMNFAVYSRNAESLVLCLYDDTASEKPAFELDLDPYVNRTGDIWHASIEDAWTFVSYGYRCKGDNKAFQADRVLLDPYAKIIGSSIPNHHESGLLPKHLGQLCKEPAFDWSGDVLPNLPMEKLVVYRLNVMRFTKDKSSKLPPNVAGTFSGVTEKVQHLKDLGVNAVLLEPIFTFDEQKGPYFPYHFFSPTNLYGPSNGSISAINSIKEMVKNLHADGIEVFLEVVFTHTAEGGALQGLDDLSYYYRNRVRDLEARNALNCNYPVVQQMILDSLQHWVTEFHIDGFCFIDASCMLRGFYGEHLCRPPLVEAIAFDPLLSMTKIIADCWDPHDMMPKEIRFPHWKKWAEMNTKFCTDIRYFLRGEGALSSLATRLCGSGDIFSVGRGPAFSFNFIAKNFGLPLVDLVSFSNAELASEISWNCGEEGPTSKTAVLERRLKQIRNFLFILFVSQGVPVLNMGDECGQSSGGSLSYGSRKLLDWDAMKTGYGIQTTQFISFFSSLRMRRSDLLQKRHFLKEENIEWHGSNQCPPGWEDPSCKFLAMTLKADKAESQLSSEASQLKGDLFIAINAADKAESLILPPPPEGMAWYRLVDTALPYPGFFSVDGKAVREQKMGFVAYEMKPRSCTLFEACADGS
ncbi:isoamylase 2, chloroplastic-like [Durio zibethinus]|uniref:Isoamylase 2, chloroplastic-like n=1 Tax=Durio zibethinus TaxID=66656 RepID=A0A6P6B211_DURZI|nr:isoamylase 2, chloroplastic-like [Durio zibethinus]XP_022771075.1 isoamylase 2, chloroplastic-like [Durio zibethinus]